MANNYVQFSASLDDLSDEEWAWFSKLRNYEFVNDEPEDGEEAAPLPEGLDLCEEEVDRLSWASNFSRDGKDMWVYAEESGDPNLVGKIVAAFLKRFRPEQRWSMTWSEGSSRMRVGEFSGGIVVADKDGWACLSAYHMEELSSKALREVIDTIDGMRKDGG